MMNNFIIFNDMSFLYNIVINCYILIIRIASITNPQARLWLSGRKKLLFKIKKSVYKKKNIVWFHCASLGEFEQAKPIICEYKSINPNHKILLTKRNLLLDKLKLKGVIDAETCQLAQQEPLPLKPNSLNGFNATPSLLPTSIM